MAWFYGSKTPVTPVTDTTPLLTPVEKPVPIPHVGDEESYEEAKLQKKMGINSAETHFLLVQQQIYHRQKQILQENREQTRLLALLVVLSNQNRELHETYEESRKQTFAKIDELMALAEKSVKNLPTRGRASTPWLNFNPDVIKFVDLPGCNKDETVPGITPIELFPSHDVILGQNVIYD